MLTRIALGLLWLLHFLPLRILNPIGQGGGLLFLLLGRERRQVTRANLRLCFPEMTESARNQIMRKHYRIFGRAVLEAGIVWWGSARRIQRLVQVEGEEHFGALGEKRSIGLVPHFAGIEHLGIRMSTDRKGMGIYAHQKNRTFDRFLLRVRTRFPGTRMISRQDGVKTILRGFRDGHYLQISPDMDLGPKDSLFVPFFGFPAATVTALPRMAKLTGAAIVPVVVRQLPKGKGYKVQVYPAWEDYPTDDVEADVRRMNTFIEERIREMPEQYLWMHKRFKTRPPGEPRIY
ncbi:MAG: lipid A biosynthesis acyltransferase [Betaproteobacteria bacterium]|nr:lipid A biosynthesis acyltransferase [Betaproteobacteria bacterium]